MSENSRYLKLPLLGQCHSQPGGRNPLFSGRNHGLVKDLKFTLGCKQPKFLLMVTSGANRTTSSSKSRGAILRSLHQTLSSPWLHHQNHRQGDNPCTGQHPLEMYLTLCRVYRRPRTLGLTARLVATILIPHSPAVPPKGQPGVHSCKPFASP